MSGLRRRSKMAKFLLEAMSPLAGLEEGRLQAGEEDKCQGQVAQSKPPMKSR
jgi:hypothetical protein